MLKRLLSGGIFRIVTESREGEIRKLLPAAKHYIVYPETTQGKKDLGNNMRQETRVGRCSHWQMERGGKPSLNSENCTEIITQQEKPQNKNLKAETFKWEHRSKI